MKLRTFDISTRRQHTYTKQATVTVNIKGTVLFSQAFCSEIGLKKGDRVLIHQDYESPGDWYIEKTDSEKGLPLCFYAKSGVVSLSSVKIVRELLKSTMGEDAEKGKFQVLTRPYMHNKTTPLYRILTDEKAAALYKEF